MASLTITWTLRYQGWAYVKVADDQGESKVIASDITNGPEQFLNAICRLVEGDADTRAEFEGEPTAYRWFFHRDGSEVDIRLVMAEDREAPDASGAVLWSGRHSIMALSRSAVRAFDQVAHELGEEGYAAQWGRSFPRTELEALRTAMRIQGSSIPDISARSADQTEGPRQP
ncbi:hypothetical protein ACFYYN_43205 [Streptomyces sp. NPDC001902]